MKKIMILIAAMAMATFTVQANDVQPGLTVISMDAEKPAPTESDTNGTEAEAPKK